MPKLAPYLNAVVELAEEVFIVDLQYITKYQSVTRWEEYGEDFYTLEDAIDHVKFEIEHDPALYAYRIKRKLVQTIEVITDEWDRDQ